MTGKFLLIAAAALAFAACSDEDSPREKPFDGEVVSFEASEHLLDAMTGNDVKLGPVTMSLMGMGDYTYTNAFCAKEYAVDADFDGMLFSTADRIWFSTPIIHRSTTGGAASGFPDVRPECGRSLQ